MTTSPLTVMFCCNEPSNGSFGGVVSNIQIGELIQLEGPSDLVQPDGSRVMELVACTPFDYDDSAIKVNDLYFAHRGYSRHVGNYLWDSALMDIDEVCSLLNYLMRTKEWSCTSAEESLFDKWALGQAITVDDLTRAGEPR